jgi:N-acylneuraminate cytidylyltransferase
MKKNKRLSTLALIPATVQLHDRGDSSWQSINGHPLIAYSISAALKSRVFSTVIVYTQSENLADIARYYGAEVPVFESTGKIGAKNVDMDWKERVLNRLKIVGRHYDCITVLPPNYPFRLSSTIQRAWRQFSSAKGVDALQSIETCSQHPNKMWVVSGNRLLPLLPYCLDMDSSCGQRALPKIYVHNACLEMAWTHKLVDGGRHGLSIMPFSLEAQEGLDASVAQNWDYAKQLLTTAQIQLPDIQVKAYANLRLKKEDRITSH